MIGGRFKAKLIALLVVTGCSLKTKLLYTRYRLFNVFFWGSQKDFNVPEPKLFVKITVSGSQKELTLFGLQGGGERARGGRRIKKISTSVNLWSLERIQKSCLSDQGHSMVTHGQIYFKTATHKPHAPGRRPRGGDRHGTNHASSRVLCVELSEVIFSIPIWVMGRAAAITSSLFSSGKLG